jgi:glycosyltransferase involved in cell wall biosynthesis
MIVASILDNQFFLSGVNAYWQSMAASLSAMGHEVVTIGLDSHERQWNRDYFGRLAGRTIRFETTGELATIIDRIQSLFSLIEPTLVIHHYSDFGIDISFKSRFALKTKCWKDVYICHSDDEDHYQRIWKHKNNLSAVICVSEVCKRHVVEKIRFDAERVFLHQYFISPHANQIRASYSDEWNRADHDGTTKILYAGRLESYQKRAGDLVAFVQALDRLKIGYVLHVAGCGSSEEQIKEKLNAVIREGRVIFHGYLVETDLFKLMKKCGIYISFSEFEGVSTSLIQAMWFGLIPVVSKTKSGSDFLKHLNDGLFFKIGDVSAAAENIRMIASNKEIHKQLVKSVKSTVQKQFNIKASIQQLQIIMEQLAEPNGYL